MAKAKKESRGARWTRLANEAQFILEQLREVQEDFENWRDNLPENLQGSAVGEKLDTICDIDISGALDACCEAAEADIPLGFGRD